MKRIIISTISILLCVVTMLSTVSCGRKYVEFDPGYFEITKSNMKQYFKVSIGSGKMELNKADNFIDISYSVSPKEELKFEDCYLTVKFKANEGETTKRISIDESGSANGKVTVEFETAYTVEYDYEIEDMHGVVFDAGPDDSYKNRDITKYFVHNNVRYESMRFRYNDTYVSSWRPMYSRKNNTKTLYFTDVVYTKSGTPVTFRGTFMFSAGWDGGALSAVKPMKKVTTVIFDGSLVVSDFDHMGWSMIHENFPNLKTIYIKNIVDDGGSIEANAKLPIEGVDFYLGGDCSKVSSWLSDVQFVNSIHDAGEFNIDDYEQDNRR
jgi:hypothetical protein